MSKGSASTLQLQFGSNHSSVVVLGDGCHRSLDQRWDPTWQEAAVIADENVAALYGDAVLALVRKRTRRSTLLSFPAGEHHKTRATKEQLEDQLLKQGFSRQSCIVALGGGISLDVAGFVAATYLRGVPLVSLPTTLLAQVDAAIGGKTGVNAAAGKNLIGAIHQPSLVLIDSSFLATLAPEHWGCGLAEIVKHAVVADAELFGWLERHTEQIATPPWRASSEALERCVRIKGKVVQQDEREHGLRAILNFGHTIGHAVEKAGDHSWTHGRAVALGMAVEAVVAQQSVGFPAEAVQRLMRLLAQLRLPSSCTLSFEALVPYLQRDKKCRDDAVHLCLPTELGKMDPADGRYTRAIALDQLQAAWERLCS